MAKFEHTFDKFKVTFEHKISAPTFAYFRSNPIKSTAAAVIIGCSVLQAVVGVYTSSVPVYKSVAAHFWPAPATPVPEVTMVGRWASDAAPNRILTITDQLDFDDSAITSGKLLKHGGFDNLYAFVYDGEAKCWAKIVTISHDKLLLNDHNSRQAACMMGMLKRVS